ncbi:hypothetical protein HK104_002093 [Borealophlyctis nickersoniae]|nr:hypothetical protein HK104_002093 [Borealophlyctis nickersoniae]
MSSIEYQTSPTSSEINTVEAVIRSNLQLQATDGAGAAAKSANAKEYEDRMQNIHDEGTAEKKLK